MAIPFSGTAPASFPDFELDGDVLVRYRGTSPSPDIPLGVRVIGQGAFARNMHLVSITLPEGVEIIDYGALHTCMCLTSIRLPQSLKRIEDRAFEYCRTMLTITLPDQLTYIGKRAFSNSGLAGFLDIPAAVNHIGDEAFFYCPWLSRAVFAATPAFLGRDLFAQCHKLTHIHGPKALEACLPLQSDSCATAFSDSGDKTG